MYCFLNCMVIYVNCMNRVLDDDDDKCVDEDDNLMMC